MNRAVEPGPCGPEAGAAAAELPVRVDVLIVGCGPVGATVAALLGRYGVRTLIVDRLPTMFMAPRAIALDNEALRVLQLAGLGEADFERTVIPFVRMRSPQLGEFGRVNTLGSIDGHPKLVTFYQPELEQALRRRLAQLPSVQTALGVTLQDFETHADGVSASLQAADGLIRRVEARYLVGCDGASSLVRQRIGQGFKGKTFAEDWLIVDARNAAQPIDHVEFICDHRRPVPHITAPGGRQRWEFMLLPGETRERMESDDMLAWLLAPWGGPQCMQIERRAVYRFHARCADAFSSGRVHLAGDAAHITPPFVGQGLVAGLRDAANLSWKLAWTVQGRVAASILDSYDRERRPHARAMIRLAQLMGKLVMPRNAALALLTHGAMRLARTIPPLRRYFEELGIKPPNAYRHGLFVRGCSTARLRRGAMLPQSWVRDANGSVQLSDELLGASLCLVAFGGTAVLSPDTAHAFAAAGGRVLRVVQAGDIAGLRGADICEDLTGAFLPGAVPHGWAAVVRPDRFVLHDGPLASADQLVRESLALLGSGTADAVAAPVMELMS